MEDVFGSGVLSGRNVTVENDMIADEALLSVPSFILVQLVTCNIPISERAFT